MRKNIDVLMKKHFADKGKSVEPRQIGIQKMTKKWEPCSAQGCVCFSTDILNAPLEEGIGSAVSQRKNLTRIRFSATQKMDFL